MVIFGSITSVGSGVFVVIACLHLESLSFIHLNFFRFAVLVTLTVLFGLLHNSFSIHPVRVCAPAFLMFWVRICTWARAAAGLTITIRHFRCIQAATSCLEAIRGGWLLKPIEIIAKGLICLCEIVFQIAWPWKWLLCGWWSFDLDGLGDEAKNGGRKDLKFHFY